MRILFAIYTPEAIPTPRNLLPSEKSYTHWRMQIKTVLNINVSKQNMCRNATLILQRLFASHGNPNRHDAAAHVKCFIGHEPVHATPQRSSKSARSRKNAAQPIGWTGMCDICLQNYYEALTSCWESFSARSVILRAYIRLYALALLQLGLHSMIH